jgi:hypothetical protein
MIEIVNDYRELVKHAGHSMYCQRIRNGNLEGVEIICNDCHDQVIVSYNKHDPIIWNSTLSLEDVESVLGEEHRTILQSLTAEQRLRLVERHGEKIAKGLQSGIMNEWEAIMDTAIDGTDFIKDMALMAQYNKLFEEK